MNKKVITELNIILRNELTAINQYFLHAKMLENQGLLKLYKKVYEESIDEMKHADQLTKRILFLGGLPNLQNLGKLNIGETPKEMLECDLAFEVNAIADLKKARNIVDSEGDVVTTMILEEILSSEEGHQDWLNQQLSLIKSVGVENYLSTQIE